MAATAPPQKKCKTCKKVETDADRLKVCSGCKKTFYCSTDCQKRHWNNHKYKCTKKVNENMRMVVAYGFEFMHLEPEATRPDNMGLVNGHNTPFRALCQSTWLVSRTEPDAYKLLIDTYRLRITDDFKANGYIHPGSIYGGATDGGISDFCKFLRKVDSHGILLPPWWNESSVMECVRVGLNPQTWSYLPRIIDDWQITFYYANTSMPSQLRLFGEQIYGKGPGSMDNERIMAAYLVVEQWVLAMHQALDRKGW